MVMNELSTLERSALNAILDELGEGRTEIEDQVLSASVVARENTGGGFFTELALKGEVPVHLQNRRLGENVWIAIKGMRHGLGMILHLWKDKMLLLEGYAVGPENTLPIDFEQTIFEIATEPGPFPEKVS